MGGRKFANWNDRRQKFRAILNGANCIRPASVLTHFPRALLSISDLRWGFSPDQRLRQISYY